MQSAQIEKDAGNFDKARELLAAAKAQYAAAGNAAGVKICNSRLEDLEIIQVTFPHTLTKLRELLADAFPAVSEPERESWIASTITDKLTINGQPYYFDDVITNVKFRNHALFQQDAKMYNSYKAIYDSFQPILQKAADPAFPFTNPATYQGTSSIAIPRGRLPQTGLLRLWIPLPILTGPQPNVTIASIAPQKYLKQPASTDQDIGLAYFEISLQELTEDLNISILYTFDHYEQRFVVDPSRIGAYDKKSPTYQYYTASYGNTLITPDIAATAGQVVGGEANPYLAAKMIYQYIIDNVKYSYMPHLAMWPRGESESTYVHRNKFGDCGAQSLYFTAMCRSLGIPARTTGGWQLFSGNFGSHFWAEFFLPNYGWIPVDTTAAEIVDPLKDIAPADRTAFHNFFFGSQDSMRAVVQRDIDMPLIPEAGEPIAFQLAIQNPVALCDTITDENPSFLVSEHWTHTATKLK